MVWIVLLSVRVDSRLDWTIGQTPFCLLAGFGTLPSFLFSSMASPAMYRSSDFYLLSVICWCRVHGYAACTKFSPP